MTTSPDTLVFAWGNPGRRDDGLGPALAARLGPSDDVRLLTALQPQIEHAADVAAHRRVVFVDADRAAPPPFRWERIRPERAHLGFSTHSTTPGALLALARDLFGAEPEAWVLGIRGEDFDGFDDGLSPAARDHLEAALVFLARRLGTPVVRSSADPQAVSPSPIAPCWKEESPCPTTDP